MTVILIVLMLLLTAEENLIAKTGLSFLGYLDELIIIMFLLLAIINFIKTNKIKRFNLKLSLMTISFIIIGTLSCYINSNCIFKNTLMSCFLSVKFWILLLSISSFDINESTIKKYYKALFVLEKIVLIFALINLFSLGLYKSIFPVSHTNYRFGIISVCSIFNHPGKYGWFMFFCALAHFSIYKNDNNKKELTRTIISIIACLFSLRTKVIMSIFICFVCYALYINRETLQKQLKKIIAIAILGTCLLIPFKDIIQKTYTLYFTDAEGYSVRQALMDNSIKIVKDYFPIGVGFGKYGTWYAAQNYSEYYYKYNMNRMYGLTEDNTTYGTDTFWPAIFGETGLVGSIIYIGMIILILKKLKKINSDISEYNSAISIFAIMSLVQIIIESFGSSSFNAPPDYYFVATTIGLAIARYDSMKKGKIK